MRKIDLIVIHCTATRVNRDFPVEALESCHKARGFRTIGICYEGGLDINGNPADTRTAAQKQAMVKLLQSLCTDYPEAEILGHRDLPWGKKSCPCFDVRNWLKAINFHI